MDNMRNKPLFNQQRDLSTILIVKGCLLWGFGCLKSLKMPSFLESQVTVFLEDSNSVNYTIRSVSFSLSSFPPPSLPPSSLSFLPPPSGSFFSSPLSIACAFVIAMTEFLILRIPVCVCAQSCLTILNPMEEVLARLLCP